MTAKQSGTIQRFTLDPDNLPTLTSEEAAALDAAPIDYSDIPELPNSFWDAPQQKEPVTIRLDRDVLEFFRASGTRGYQTRINEALRAFVTASRKKRVTKPEGSKAFQVLIKGKTQSEPADTRPSRKKAEA